MNSKVELKANEEGYCLPEDYLAFASEFMPMIDEESYGTFCSTWEIKDWSTLSKKSPVRGPKFKTDEHEWDVLLYPSGNNQPNHVSIYLESIDLRSDPTTAKDICAQVIFCLVNPTDPTRFMHQSANHRFNEREADYGFTQFTEIKELLGEDDRKTPPLIIDDSIHIVTIVRLVKDPTGVLWHNFINYDSKEMTGYVGLYNQGATCYMNSLFQSLYFTNQYRKAVYQMPTENDIPDSSPVYALQRLFYNLQFSNTAAVTTELTKSFGWNSIDSFMQHDVQEFNRLLQEHIEKAIRGTPAEDSIKKLFVGRMKSYIKCINVEYESAKTEDFYDIQLNVKGCKNLEESFKNYILEETLEGENKYMADKHGLQDAKKGVIFESFPPVLHLQLKRFEYDMVKDSMVKINDRHEFPTEIDLEPYLSENADRSESHKYQLHGVLVHKGNLTGGHYFAFVRPGKDDKWFKFNDDIVTPATLKHVLEDNFGGEKIAYSKLKKRSTNAYMLVYIRESQQDKILEQVTEKDVPTHLVERLHKERLVLEEIQRLRAQQHLYMKAYITADASFLMNNGAGFVQFDELLPPTNPPTVVVEQVLKTQLLKDYLHLYASKLNIPPHHIRIWNLANRRNGGVQPCAPFTSEDLDLPMEELCHKLGDIPFLRFYMEYVHEPILKNSLPNDSMILIFIKLFDPDTQTIRGIGKLYVDKSQAVFQIENQLNEMVGNDIGTPIDMYEEGGFGLMEHLDKLKTFDENGLDNGDIICFQKQILYSKYSVQISNEERYYYSNAPDYMLYLYNRIWIKFSPIYNNSEEFTLLLRRDMSYDQVVEILGNCIHCNPDDLLLITTNYYGNPNNRPVRPTDEMVLLDILQCSNNKRKRNEQLEVQQQEDTLMATKLFYDIKPPTI